MEKPPEPEPVLPPFIPVVPAWKPKVDLGLTCGYIVLYGILFSMIFIQLWMILYYRHRRLSYQTVFLFLSLVWSGLRISLFSFYFNDCAVVNIFSVVPYWLLFSCPVCLQFTILCLLVLYFSQVICKARVRHDNSNNSRQIRKLLLKICLGVSAVIFLVTNIVYAFLYKYSPQSETFPIYYLYTRVAICDALFILMSVVLSFCIYQMANIASASVVLEAKGTTKCQALTACALTVLLYLSRAIYNIIAICQHNSDKSLPSFGYDWINVTDQADFVHLDRGYAYVSFAIVLFVWEVLPMFIVIIFFRVRKPDNSRELQALASHNQNSNGFFFDNPRRYDSEENLLGDHLNSPVVVHVTHALNSSDESQRESPTGTPSKPRLGYGAVTSTEHNYTFGGSPLRNAPTMGQVVGSYD